METTTPFDLNRALQHWRENLSASPAFCGENLDELEAHLRDSISTLQSRGLDAGEAFLIATCRLGKENLLRSEFAKINRSAIWLDRVLWIAIGIQVWESASNVMRSIASVLFSLFWRDVKPAYDSGNFQWQAFPAAVAVLTQVAAMAASVAICCWLIVCQGPKIGNRLKVLLSRRSTLIAACAGLSLLLLAGWLLSISLEFFSIKFAGSGGRVRVAIYGNGSYWIMRPIEVIAAVTFILLLARKRFRLNRA